MTTRIDKMYPNRCEKCEFFKQHFLLSDDGYRKSVFGSCGITKKPRTTTNTCGNFKLRSIPKLKKKVSMDINTRLEYTTKVLEELVQYVQIFKLK